MSKFRLPRNTQSPSATPSPEPPSKPLTLPPPNDPSWKEFAEQHREFLEARPNYEKQMAARVQALAEQREKPNSQK